jgi:hypothetical protein
MIEVVAVKSKIRSLNRPIFSLEEMGHSNVLSMAKMDGPMG